MDPKPLEDLGHVIQISIAPVFLLTAVGTILSVLTTRLARIVDRSRTLRERPVDAEADRRLDVGDELKRLEQRRRLVNLALVAGTVTALLVCLLIAVTFVGYMAQFTIGMVVAWLFVLAMGSFILTLVSFLREVLLASAPRHPSQ
jgi:hypothetical protein